MSEADLNTLCRIEAKKDGYCSTGCGVMISPRRVLTALHVVSGGKDLTFISPEGRRTFMKRKPDGGVHIIDKDLDLAVIELQASLCEDFALVNFHGLEKTRASRQLFRGRGWLGTMFGGAAKGHEVTFDPLMHEVESMHSHAIAFQAAVRAEPGYSGSAVFGSDGCTVVSIATTIAPKRQEMEVQMSQMLGGTPKISFNGPSPDAFSSFMRKVNNRTGFLPGGPTA